jgi:hypothetical protein
MTRLRKGTRTQAVRGPGTPDPRREQRRDRAGLPIAITAAPPC